MPVHLVERLICPWEWARGENKLVGCCQRGFAGHEGDRDNYKRSCQRGYRLKST
jgi:hypothetical protein